MKKIKINLALLALLIGVTGAFAFMPHERNSKTSELWQTVDSMGQTIPVSSGGVVKTVSGKSDAETQFECSGTQEYCAGHVLIQDGPVQNNDYIFRLP